MVSWLRLFTSSCLFSSGCVGSPQAGSSPTRTGATLPCTGIYGRQCGEKIAAIRFMR